MPTLQALCHPPSPPPPQVVSFQWSKKNIQSTSGQSSKSTILLYSGITSEKARTSVFSPSLGTSYSAFPINTTSADPQHEVEFNCCSVFQGDNGANWCQLAEIVPPAGTQTVSSRLKYVLSCFAASLPNAANASSHTRQHHTGWAGPGWIIDEL